jgi:DNA-binding response OmpR family regulator
MTQPTEKILLVDADQNLLRQLGTQLYQAGYHVVVAENGQEALARAQQVKPTLTILDLLMPDMAGVEVCRRLRKAHLNMHVIILTAMDSADDHIAGLEAGADDYILKPVNPKELILRVKSVLRRTNQTTYLAANPVRTESPRNTAPLLQNGMPSRGTNPLPRQLDPRHVQRVNGVLQVAAQEAQLQNISGARELYLEVLNLDPNNETALIWLAWHTTDPYDGVRFLEKLVENHPENTQFQEFLAAGKRRCQELDQLISGSGVLGYWTMAEQIQQERVTKGLDRRSASVTPVGQLLLQKGYITREQLETAVVVHEMFTRLGEPKKLGEVLLEYGYLTQEQLQTVLSEQVSDFNSNFY